MKNAASREMRQKFLQKIQLAKRRVEVAERSLCTKVKRNKRICTKSTAICTAAVCLGGGASNTWSND